MHRFGGLLFFVLFGLAACSRPQEVITFDWHGGLSPVLQSEHWRVTSDGRLVFTREQISVYRAEARPNTHAELRISATQFRELFTLLEPVRVATKRRGRTPCTAPDLPGFSVKYERPMESWHWSSEVGCEAQSAAATMQAAIDAKLLLERWTGPAAQ